MNTILPVAKLILIGLYICAAVSRVVPALMGISNILIGLAVLLLAVHVVEYIVLKDKLTAKAPGKSHFLPTFLFGVAHTIPILK